MKIIETPLQWRALLQDAKGEGGKSLGFVPTMGALHQGHMSLVQKCCEENDISSASIFVNPTQFNDPTDFEKYPDTLDTDIELLEKAGVDYLFLPKVDDLYPDAKTYAITESDVSADLCGISRPGHFDGVLTVVMKLINLTGPTRAYFGEKDWQQYQLVKGMAQAFFLETEVIAGPTVREKSGLAMSSRNLRLSQDNLDLAPLFYKILSKSIGVEEKIEILENYGFDVDYIKEIGGRVFGAVYLGDVRLIDNCPSNVHLVESGCTETKAMGKRE